MAKKRQSTYRFQKLAKQFRAECVANNAVCWLCGQKIDYNADPNDNNAFNIDHLLPVSTHPELQDDINNFRPSHRGCNIVRGNRDTPPPLGLTSRNW